MTNISSPNTKIKNNKETNLEILYEADFLIIPQKRVHRMSLEVDIIDSVSSITVTSQNRLTNNLVDNLRLHSRCNVAITIRGNNPKDKNNSYISTVSSLNNIRKNISHTKKFE